MYKVEWYRKASDWQESDQRQTAYMTVEGMMSELQSELERGRWTKVEIEIEVG